MYCFVFFLCGLHIKRVRKTVACYSAAVLALQSAPRSHFLFAAPLDDTPEAAVDGWNSELEDAYAFLYADTTGTRILALCALLLSLRVALYSCLLSYLAPHHSLYKVVALVHRQAKPGPAQSPADGRQAAGELAGAGAAIAPSDAGTGCVAIHGRRPLLWCISLAYAQAVIPEICYPATVLEPLGTALVARLCVL